MTTTEQRAVLEKLVRELDAGARLVRAWRLEGGISAEVTALEIETVSGETRKLVVRRHGPRDLAANPHVAADEFALLQRLAAAGLAVPEPRFVDDHGHILGSPCLVVDFVVGGIREAGQATTRQIETLARFLGKLHDLDILTEDMAFLDNYQDFVAAKLATMRTRPDATLSENEILGALRTAWPPPTNNQPVMLHGDFWFGNVLWQDDRIAAVLDWEDAAIGDPLADLGNARLELFWSSGAEAMEAFTRAYLAEAEVDTTALPHWDLWAALRPSSTFANWGLDEAVERDMRDRHRLFVAQALNRMAATAATL